MSQEPIVVSLEEAAQELLRRRRARSNLIDFSCYVNDSYIPDEFHRKVAEALEEIERGENDRLMIFAPPQHGKSQLATRHFPAYLLALNPKQKVISASYNKEFADGFGRDVRDIIETREFSRLFPEVRIRSDNRSAGEWAIENGGTYFSVGVGSATTGRGANCLTANAMVQTDIGEIAISHLAEMRDSVQILGYDHCTNQPVWTRCSAFSHRQADGFYRITTASGRVVEATAEHPVFANGRYIAAAFLAPGDRLMRLLFESRDENGVRVSKKRKAQTNQVLLQPGMLVPIDQHEAISEPGEMLGMQKSTWAEGGSFQREILQPFLQGFGCHEAQAEGPSTNARPQDDPLRAVRDRVSSEDGGWSLLQQGLQGHRPCTGDDRRRKSQLAKWSEPGASSASFCSIFSADSAEDPEARQFHVRGLYDAGSTRSASYKHECIGQQTWEPRDTLCHLPHEMARGGAFEAEEDTVALVEFVREPTDVFDIEVAGTHNFFANGLLVHNCFLIDDPIKGPDDADSDLFREKQWEWYKSVVFTRLQEKSAIILTLTRWHHDDLAGRLLKLQEEGKGRPWKVLRFPAIPEALVDAQGEYILDSDGRVPGDPLGRRPEEPLAPNRFSYETLLEKQDVLGDRSWSAMYQQRPIALDGGMFRSAWFKPWDDLPMRRTKVRAWDFAASSKGDYTVGVLMSRCAKGVFYVEDIIRFRGSAHQVMDKVIKTAKDDGHGVKIVIPEDPGQAGKAQALSYTRALAGYNIKAVRASGDKETAARPFAAQAEGGNVFMPAGSSWRTPFIQEIETFPLGSHDDQVDAASSAFNALLGPRRAAVVRL